MTQHPRSRRFLHASLFFSIAVCFQTAALVFLSVPGTAAEDPSSSRTVKKKSTTSTKLLKDPAWINAETKRRQDRLSEAAVIYLDLIKRYPEEVRLRAALADTLNRLSQNEEALLHINTAKSLAPYHPNIILLRGRILERLARFAEAEREYRGWVGLDPDSRIGQFSLAVVLRKQERLKEARSVLNLLIRKWPQWPELLYESAVCAVEAKDWTRARKDLNAAEQLGFDQVDPLVRIKIDIKHRN